jgi:hypothetical protein
LATPAALVYAPAMFKFVIVLVSMLSIASSACCMASVSALPKEGGITEIISTSATEKCAIDKAQERAQEVCMGKRFVVVANETIYQGADPNAKLAVAVLTRQNGNSQNDYRTAMTVKCE